MERYGYVRVSAKDQNPERQFLAMQEQQIKEDKIIVIITHDKQVRETCDEVIMLS